MKRPQSDARGQTPDLMVATNSGPTGDAKQILLQIFRIERDRCFCQHLRAAVRDVDDVFAAHAELAVLVNPGLIAEGHSGFELDRAALHEVRPFVSFQADPVTQTMCKEFVTGTVALSGDVV